MNSASIGVTSIIVAHYEIRRGKKIIARKNRIENEPSFHVCKLKNDAVEIVFNSAYGREFICTAKIEGISVTKPTELRVDSPQFNCVATIRGEDLQLYYDTDILPLAVSQENVCSNVMQSPIKSCVNKIKPFCTSPTKCTPEKKRTERSRCIQDTVNHSSVVPMIVELSNEQQAVVNACLKGHNVFFSGGAGTGKSFVLRHIVEGLTALHTAARVFVTATTGLSACLLGGTTIHQFVGFHNVDEDLEYQIQQILQKGSVVRRWCQAKVLIVDEVSMLSPKLLVVIDAVAKATRASSAPMGGLQVVFTGDFFQLPPVTSSKIPSKPTLDNMYCFQADIWDNIIHKNFLLTTVYRQQGDEQYKQLLDKVRFGNTEGISELNLCVGRKLNTSTTGILPTKIFTHKRDVDSTNEIELKKLPGTAFNYISEDRGEECYVHMLRSNCPARAKLTLKLGAQVILVKNIDQKLGLVNGARGIVISFTRDTKNPVVKFQNLENGTQRDQVIFKETFSLYSGGKLLARRSQIPLELSWGISVHKAQGMSVDQAVLHMKNVFEFGQAYVALSRIKTLDGLSLAFPIEAKHIRAHPAVVEFYRKSQYNPSAEA